jgi:hypothetical protein
MARNLPKKKVEAEETAEQPEATSAFLDLSDTKALADALLAAVEAPIEALRAPVEPQAPPPVTKRYKVVKGGRLVYRGYVTNMAVGKIVSDAQYDLDVLQEQGILIEEIGE